MSTDPLTSTQPADMAKIREWTGRFLSGPTEIPISFKLDGKAVTGIPDAWQPVSRKRRIDANIVETVFEGRKGRTGLGIRVECVEYLDYPVVEWTAWFTNTGSKPTPVLSDILALDGVFQGASPRGWQRRRRATSRRSVNSNGHRRTWPTRWAV